MFENPYFKKITFGVTVLVRAILSSEENRLSEVQVATNPKKVLSANISLQFQGRDVVGVFLVRFLLQAREDIYWIQLH